MIIYANHEEFEIAFHTLTLLVGNQEEHLACKKIEWLVAGVVIYLA